jgi:hypothetical protein
MKQDEIDKIPGMEQIISDLRVWYTPGKMYWITNYGGICGYCGAPIKFDKIPAVYVGVYMDTDGREYLQFDAAVWIVCKECKTDNEGIRLWIDLCAMAIIQIFQNKEGQKLVE